MADRFEDLVKIPKEPAKKILAKANARLDTKIDAPASAPPQVVLAELDEKGAMVDLLYFLAILLPPRERVWWACLAGRDWIGKVDMEETLSLKYSEAWVFKPTDENREEARAAIDHAYVDDDTVHIATAVLYADGTLGPGELANYPAPAGAAEAAAFAMNIVALSEHSDRYDEYGKLLIDRALDIARGGNGNFKLEDAEQQKEEAET